MNVDLISMLEVWRVMLLLTLVPLVVVLLVGLMMVFLGWKK